MQEIRIVVPDGCVIEIEKITIYSLRLSDEGKAQPAESPSSPMGHEDKGYPKSVLSGSTKELTHYCSESCPGMSYQHGIGSNHYPTPKDVYGD